MFGKPTKKQLYKQVEEIAKAYRDELEYSCKVDNENLELWDRLDKIENEYMSYQEQYGDFPSMDDYDAAQLRIRALEKKNQDLELENLRLMDELLDLEAKIQDTEWLELCKKWGIEP